MVAQAWACVTEEDEEEVFINAGEAELARAPLAVDDETDHLNPSLGEGLLEQEIQTQVLLLVDGDHEDGVVGFEQPPGQAQ